MNTNTLNKNQLIEASNLLQNNQVYKYVVVDKQDGKNVFEDKVEITGNSENKRFLFFSMIGMDDCEQLFSMIEEDGTFEPMYGDGQFIAHFENI